MNNKLRFLFLSFQPHMKCYTEEIFGPVLVILDTENLDDVCTLTFSRFSQIASLIQFFAPDLCELKATTIGYFSLCVCVFFLIW